MKKILSLALTLAMLCSMAVTASAEVYHVVGEHGNADIDVAGDDAIVDGLNSTDITIEVSVGETKNKYAVDLEYTPLELSISGGSLTWDVNELAYKASDDLSMSDKQDQQIIVRNYSDKPVNVLVAIQDKDNADHINVTFDENSQIKDSVYELAEATPASSYGAGNGVPATANIVYDVTADDDNWDAVVDYYTPLLTGGTKSKIVATISVTISEVGA